MLKPPGNLETQRLLLRAPVLNDADIIFQKYAQDLEVTKYLIWRPHESVDITREFIQKCITFWNTHEAFSWVIVRKTDTEILGMFELRINKFSADIGYVLAKDYWGLGYATEVTKCMVDWALNQEHIYRVWATCDVGNIASARVLEKAGMKREGVLRRFIVHPNICDEPRDSYCYSAIK